MRKASACVFVVAFVSCKPVSQSASPVAASQTASGEEVALSANSTPAPVLPPKLSAADLEAARYSLGESFPRAEVGARQKAGSSLTGTPVGLQGIWWMDGNPIPDETVSFADMDFSQEKPLMPVFGANNFSFHGAANLTATEARHGEAAFNAAKIFGLIYEFQFDGSPERYDHAKIIPTFLMHIGPVEKRLRLSEKILGFTMNRVGPNLYSRDNTARGQPVAGYQLRRILVPSASDPTKLEKTEWWDLYVNQPVPTHLRLPKQG